MTSTIRASLCFPDSNILWLETNVPPKEGQLIFTSDGYLRIGNGTSLYKDLPIYISPESKAQHHLLYPGGTAANPASIHPGDRLVIPNPTNLDATMVRAEVLYGNKWGSTGKYVTGDGTAYFVEATCSKEEIIIQAGASGVMFNPSFLSGNGFGVSDSGTISELPFRVHVWGT